MYSFSTCWNSHRHTDGRLMLREIRELGFEWAELSHGIRVSLLPGILEAVEAKEMKISSLHNFCPLPLGVTFAAPNLFQFSSTNHRERDNAYKHSVKTIETAARLNAQVVVLHMGSIEMKEYTDELLELVAKGQRETEKYEELKAKVIKKREKKKEENVAYSSEMLERLAEKAKEHGVKLGIENRQAVEEIPLESDIGVLLREFERPEVGYWHDTGHAQIKENLGFVGHALMVESLAHRLLGFHIHDVAFPGHDHRCPGTGCVNFAAIKPVLKAEHIKVFELSPSLTPHEAKLGVEHVKWIWGEG